MYYSLISHQVSFSKKPPSFFSQVQQSKLKRILPLSNHQALLFYDNFLYYHVNLVTLQFIHKGVLEGVPFDAISVTDQKVILMINEKKNIVELDLSTKRVKEIYKITSDSLYNSKKQLSQFSLSRLHPFTHSHSFFLQQNLTDQRKVKFIYFPSISEKGQSNILSGQKMQSGQNMQTAQQNIPQTQTHQQTTQLQPPKPFQVRQFEAKNYLYLKLDELSSIVRFRQNPQENAKFAFDQINLQTNSTIQHKFDHPSFILYSTIIDIKKYHQQKYIICLNSKNSSHQLIIYNPKQKTIITLCQSDKIFKHSIFINQKLNLCMFSSLYGQTLDSQILTLLDLNKGKIIYQIEEKVDKLLVSRAKDYLIEYSVESKAKKDTSFKVYVLANKTAHYLKMMENLKVDSIFGEQFVNQVAQMLKP